MFNTVSQLGQSYYDQLPVDGVKAVGLSALTSFLASVTVIALTSPHNQTPDLSRVGVAVVIAVVASTIHTLTTPIFNYLFDNPTNSFYGYQEWTKTFFAMTSAHIVINLATPFKVNLITAMKPSGADFIIIPHTLFKIMAGLASEVVNQISLTFSNRRIVPNLQFGLNFNVNSSPVWITF